MISIIIVNFNGEKYLQKCVESILAQSFDKFELIIFDNNSTDNSLKVMEEFSDKRISIIKSKQNLGFAGGNNEAYNQAKNDLIVLLNNDTIVAPDWLKYLSEAIEKKNCTASSFVITEGIPKEHYESNGSVSYLLYNIMNVFKTDEDEFYPNGCSMIFRKSETGLPFDEDYFMYGEDVWFGLKCRFRNIKIKFVRESVVNHAGEGSNTNKKLKTYYAERNRKLNLYTFFSFWFIIRISPIILFVSCGKMINSIFNSDKSFIGLMKAYFWIIFNIPVIIKKHKAMKKEKILNEKDVIKYMSSKLVNDNNVFGKMVNGISYIYSRIVGIKPVEYFDRNSIT